MKSTHKRSGKIVVLVAMLLPILLGLGAFAIDIGNITYMRSQVQAGADAAALAIAQDLDGFQEEFDAIALRYATINAPDRADLKITVEPGTWDSGTTKFTSDTTTDSFSDCNSVRVRIVRENASTFFGNFIGKKLIGVSATAIACRSIEGAHVGFRFMIDNEMFDKGIPALDNLANRIGRDPEELVTARGFNQGKQFGGSNWTWEDNFLDVPAGEIVELPTGQGTDYNNNDAGIFDIDHPEFPFADDQSFQDFMMYSESGNDSSKWGFDQSYIGDQLDPLPGVEPVTDSSRYDSFVDPDFVHVSPVAESDLSTLNKNGNTPQINAKGLRRGLVAYKIIGVGADVDGDGSVLPNLIIEFVDPSTIRLDQITRSLQSSSKLRLVD